MNEYAKLGNEQAGFRYGQSTMDHVFVLHHILGCTTPQIADIWQLIRDGQMEFDK